MQMEKQEIHNKTILEKSRIKFLSLKLSKLQEPIMFINGMRKRTEITLNWQLKIHNYKNNKV